MSTTDTPAAEVREEYVPDAAALEWASSVVQRQIQWARDAEAKMWSEGKVDIAMKFRQFANGLEMRFLGGGCVVGPFDPRNAMLRGVLGEGASGHPPASVIPADTRPYETQTAALDALPVHTLVSYRDHDGELHTLEKTPGWRSGDSVWWETTARQSASTYNLVRNEVDYTIVRMGDGS